MEHAAGGCILAAYPQYYQRGIYFNIYAGPDASDTRSSSQNFYKVCKLTSPSQPPPPAPPQEYVPVGYIGRWRYANASLYWGDNVDPLEDYFDEYVLEATGQFSGNYKFRSGPYTYNSSYVGAYLQTTCTVEAEGNMVTKDLYWTKYADYGFAQMTCSYRTRNSETRQTVAGVDFHSVTVYSVADLQARYAPGNCPDLAVAMTDGVAWMRDPYRLTTVIPFNCIEDCLDFTCALAIPPPSPPPWPPSAPARFAPTVATASFYGLAIGIPVGVCLLGVAICSAIYWFKRRRQTLAANASAHRAAPLQVEITAKPQVVTHSELLTKAARTASTDGQYATPQQVDVTLSQPESLIKTAQVASTDLRDGDAGTTYTKEAREELGGVMENAQPTRLAALLAACGLEHRAMNFEDEGYTFEDLMGAIKQGGEAAVKSDLQDLKLSLGERRRIITQLQSSRKWL